EAGFAKARAAVDDYLTRVSESQLLQVAGLQPLRRDLLQSALTFYQGFVKERDGEPALRAGLASALLRVGKIQKELGQDSQSKSSLDQATALHKALLMERPGDIELKAALAECHYQQGHNARAIAIWTSLVQPETLRFRKELANTYTSLAVQHGEGNRPDQQLAACQQALSLWEGLVGADPEDPEYQIGLSATLNNLGVVLNSKGQLAEALAMFRRAVEHAGAAHARSPHVIRYGRSLAISTANVGTRLRALNLDQNETLMWEWKGNDLWKRLAAENPSVPSIQSAYFWNSRQIAFHLRKAGQADESARLMRQARATFERMPNQNPLDLYNLACVRALCAEIPPGAEKDPLFEDDPEERRRFADLAVEAVSKAIDAGFNDANLIKTDHDLLSIRDRDDFQALIARLVPIVKGGTAAEGTSNSDKILEAGASLVARRARLLAADAGDAKLKGDLAASKHAFGLL
ncbi:tetratricopeptide repeat protein, partial [Singulisphaera rosea]